MARDARGAGAGPAAPPHETGVGGDPPGPSPGPAEPAAILWAEDAPDDQYLIRSVLEGLPDVPQVRFVRDGLQALHEAGRSPPRLLVLDVNMPMLDGVEALRRLRSDLRLDGTPVVMFSTSGDAAEVERCRRLGADDYVRKPIAFDEFSSAVLGIVARAKAAGPIH